MKKQQKLIKLIYSNSKYSGKHIVISGNKIFTANTGPEASHILEKIVRSHPSETPLITYVPKSDALILFL